MQLLEMRYDTQLDTDGKEFIGFAVEGVSLMQTLIDDVLTYSKVDLKGIEWELTNVQDALRPGPWQPAGPHRRNRGGCNGG